MSLDIRHWRVDDLDGRTDGLDHWHEAEPGSDVYRRDRSFALPDHPAIYRSFGPIRYEIAVMGNAFGSLIPPDDHVNVVLMQENRRHQLDVHWSGWSTVGIVQRITCWDHLKPAQALLARYAKKHALKQVLS